MRGPESRLTRRSGFCTWGRSEVTTRSGLGSVGVAVVLVLVGCQPAVTPEELLRAGDRIGPTITITSHVLTEGYFLEPSTTIAGTIADLARADGTQGSVVSATWSVIGSATGGELTLADDGSFSIPIDTQNRAIELLVGLVASDWNGNETPVQVSLAVPKEMLSYVFERAENAHLPFDALGTISGTDIEVPVADGTVVSALIATFTYGGASVRVGGVEQQSGVDAQDFSGAVVYTVTGRDGLTKDFTVRVEEVAAYYGQAQPPTLDPEPATYDHDIQVVLSTTTAGGVIYYTTDGNPPTSGGTRYTVAIPVAGHGTSVTVKAITYAPGHTASEVASGVYTISYPVPSAPSGLSAAVTSPGTTIHLAWTDNSTNETAFKVERSPNGTSGWEEVHQTGPNVTSWDDSGLLPELTTFYFRLKATNAGSDSTYAGPASAVTLLSPSGLSVAALSRTSIRLVWTDNSSFETAYKIERSLNGADWAEAYQTAPNATTIWDDTGRSVGTGYHYRVRATTGAVDSAYSNTAHTSTFFTDMVYIDGRGEGGFTMGDGTYGPNVTQAISYPYHLTKCEITHSQFGAFIDDGGYTTSAYWTTNGWNYKDSQGWTQPSLWADPNYNGANQPVVGVSWYEAVAFCNWRSVKEGLTPAYDSSGRVSLTATGYRLPTEVEWEYAAAKGASGQAERIYAYGDTYEPNRMVCTDTVPSPTKPAEVGSKSTGNPLTTGDTPQGLCDMSGNVWEWCSDNRQADASVTTATDRYIFANDSTSQVFVLRGGSWSYGDTYLRCAYRSGFGGPGGRDYDIGFRGGRRGG